MFAIAGLILESKGMRAIFQKKGKKKFKREKRTKYLKIWAKIYKISNYIEKGKAARKVPGLSTVKF